jgi:peptidyl-tRNA hydrolase
VPAEVAKLQVSGLVLHDVGAPARPASGEEPMVSLALTPLLSLTTGKAAAQCGHAAQLAAMAMDLVLCQRWVSRGAPLRLLSLGVQEWNEQVPRSPVVVTDAGFTEVPPGTRTALAWWR